MAPEPELIITVRSDRVVGSAVTAGVGGPVSFVRYELAEPGRRGTHPGVFAVTNGLARAGRLSEPDWSWWRTNNDWYERELPNPATADPSLFGRAVNPLTSC